MSHSHLEGDPRLSEHPQPLLLAELPVTVQVSRQEHFPHLHKMILTRPGVDKVKPKGWFKYSLLMDFKD